MTHLTTSQWHVGIEKDLIGTVALDVTVMTVLEICIGQRVLNWSFGRPIRLMHTSDFRHGVGGVGAAALPLGSLWGGSAVGVAILAPTVGGQ